MMLGGMVLPTREHYDPTVPWVPHQDEPEAIAGGIGVVVGGSEWNQRALKVRMAMFYAINYQAIIDKIFYGEAEVAPLRAWTPFGDPIWNLLEWKPIPYDPELARQLLVEAGYPDGFEVRMHMFTHALQPELLDIAEAIARDWDAVGLKVERVMIDRSVFRAYRLNRDTAGMAWLEAVRYKAEPWESAFCFWRTTSAAVYGFESPDADPIFEKPGITIDFDERLEAALALGDYLYERWIGHGLAMSNTLLALSPRVGDFHAPIPIGGFPFANFEYVTRAE